MKDLTDQCSSTAQLYDRWGVVCNKTVNLQNWKNFATCHVHISQDLAETHVFNLNVHISF